MAAVIITGQTNRMELGWGGGGGWGCGWGWGGLGVGLGWGGGGRVGGGVEEELNSCAFGV